MTNISWIDTATIRRQNTVKGSHFEKNSTVAVYENIPCHLSELSEKRLANSYQRRQVESIDYDFKLFCAPNIEICINDIIEVITASGQKFKIYAGRSRRYKLTCQTACYFNPVAVEVKK